MWKRILIAIVAAIALACADQTSQTPSVDAASPDVQIAGIYHVSGVTVDLGNGNRREIAGSVVLNVEGDRYTSTYELSTLFPTQEGALEADVIGEGSGSIEGLTLTGDARTQVVVSTVPGVDPAFAFVPRTTTTRIVNTSVTKINADGSVEIDIENNPADGESYSPTRTTLKGRRVESGTDSRVPDAATDPHAPTG
jgi:hypothetical protein